MAEFSAKYIYMTSELGASVQKFRKFHSVKADLIAERIGKTLAWYSKFEKGLFQKIVPENFKVICDIIYGSDHGIQDLLIDIYKDNFSELSQDTKITIDNIEDLVLDYPLPKALVDGMILYKEEREIDLSVLAAQIKKNNDFIPLSDPDNLWTKSGIRFKIPPRYIFEMYDRKIERIHLIILEEILFTMYQLGEEDQPREKAQGLMRKYSLYRIRDRLDLTQHETKEAEATELGREVSDTLDAFREFLVEFSSKYDDKCKKGMRQIADNVSADPSLFFAFIQTNIGALKDKTQTTKQEYLHRIRNLTKRYAEKDDHGIDLYH